MTRLLGLLLVASCVSLQAQQPTRTEVEKARADVLAIFDRLLLPKPTVITAANLQAVINASPAGAVLMLPPGLIVPDPIVIVKSVTLIGSPVSPATATTPLPSLQGGVWVTAGTVFFRGVEFRLPGNPWGNIVEISDLANVTFDSVRGLGDPVNGQKRFIAANGGRFELTRSICDDIFSTSDDAQCVAAWDTPGPMFITDNPMLRASTENILIGGADPSSPDRVPTEITITGNYIAKKPAWKGTAILVKNLLELKNARQVTIAKNTFEYNWGAAGGHAWWITVRNQDGTAPYSSVETVIFDTNTVRHVAAAIQMLGSDNEHPSGPVKGVTFLKNLFEDVNPKTWSGSDQMILIVRGPQDVRFDTNTFAGANIGSVIYFADAPTSREFNVTDNQWPLSFYGINGADAAPEFEDGRRMLVNGLPRAWSQWVASGTLSGNVER